MEYKQDERLKKKKYHCKRRKPISIMTASSTKKSMAEEDRIFAKEMKKQNKELLELLLKKTGVKKKDLVDMVLRDFVKENLYLLSPEERQQFDCLAL